MWISATLFYVIVILLCIWFFRYATYKPENFPPGPPRIPFLGSYWLTLIMDRNFPHFPFQKLAKIYGKTFGLYLGPFLTVVTTDYETCVEVINRAEFDGKPDLPAARYRNIDAEKRLGIFFTEGKFWHEQRRFSLRHLRDYGFGRRFEKLENLMAEQLSQIIEFMKYPINSVDDEDIVRGDKAFYFPDILYAPQMNAVMSMFGMEPVNFGTERYRHFRHVGRHVLMFQHGIFPIMTMNFLPWMKHIAPETTGYNCLMRSNKVLFPFFKEIIDDIRSNRTDDDEIRCFYDRYFNKMKGNEEENNSFSDSQLIMTTIDFMFPAVSAVPVVIVQILFSMILYPDIRIKMQAEIDQVVGSGRLPTLDDRKDMPFTEAVIREVLRKESLVPLGIVHKVTEDTTLKGFTLPKDTTVYTSLYAAHNDKKIWGDPENFRPERFIDSNGKLLKKDYSLPFGAGKRLCAGETFARNSMFLIVSCLYQNFTFEMPSGVNMPNLQNKYPGVLNTQKDECWVHAIPR